MPSLISELHQDHVNLSRLLQLLERELLLFQHDDTPNYFLLLDMVEYVENYPDLIHHPREDAMFRVFLERSQRSDALVRRLIEEHRSLAEQSRELRNVLEQAQNGVVVSRPMLEESLSNYLDVQRTHLNVEETEVFPTIDQVMTPADWARVDQFVPVSTDPLFGGSVQKRYQSVFDHIIALS
jgi:hemerythrin-like domain-containing protein